jgi:cell division septation protein DedD
MDHPEEGREKMSHEPGGHGGHGVQALVWGICLSVVMFGLGFMAGNRYGEQQAAEKTPVQVSRLIPPPFEIRTPGVEESQAAESEANGRVWGILTGQESPLRTEPAVAPPRPRPPENPPKPAPPASTPPSPSTPQPPALSAPPPTPPPAPVFGRAGSTRYSVQVVSVQGREKAETVVKELNGKGYPVVRIIPAEVPGRGTWYRIRVGDFDRREEAEGLANKIRERERLQPQLVAEKY